MYVWKYVRAPVHAACIHMYIARTHYYYTHGANKTYMIHPKGLRKKYITLTIRAYNMIHT